MTSDRLSLRLLHITYTTLWRKENEGVIKKHKMGRRNLYSKKEVLNIFSSEMESAGKGII